MPVIDLGSVMGPPGQDGVGSQGQQGIQGDPGPNQVTSLTSTTLNGLLYGNGSTVGTKVFGPNYTVYATESNIRVTFSSISGTGGTVTKSVTNGLITSNHEVVAVQWGNPAAQTGDVTWTTVSGTFNISGTFNGSTTAVFVLMKRGTTVSES